MKKQGYNSKEIAEALQIGLSTVNRYGLGIRPIKDIQPGTIDKVFALRNAGWTIDAIASDVLLDISVIEEILEGGKR